MNLRIGSYALAVLHAQIEQLARALSINEDTGDHQRSEKIAFSAFIDAEMRLEHFGEVDFVVAQPGLAEDFPFKHKLHALLASPALQPNLWTFLINCYAQLLSLRKENRVWLRRKGEASLS